MKIVLSFDVPESPENINFVDIERLVSSIEICAINSLIDEKNCVAEQLEVSYKRDLAKAYDKSIDSTEVRCWTYART